MDKAKNETKNLIIRPFRRSDREAILGILRESAMFTEEEIILAQNRIDTWLDREGQEDYVIFAAEFASTVAGYVCFGPTHATEATYDLYWIAVSPALQGRSIGGKLLKFAEKEIASRGGRIIVIETSSTQKYLPTRRFYENRGYTREARIRDFYRVGDDKLMYTKNLHP